jgi:PAB-dependent poly(A)-specific ribonuclease subunit 3
MYGGGSNYVDQISNGYNQMNLGQNTDYSSYLAGTPTQTQQYDPMSDMYFQTPTNYQPVSVTCIMLIKLQYHLYTSAAPRRQDLAANQRTAADFFIPDDLRETLQRKNEAAQHVFLDTSLPKNIKGYHSLVPLDTSRDREGSMRRFGYPSWIYKADSTKFGKKYALRRLENYKLANEETIHNVHKWKRVKSACVVSFHEAFTTKAFEDDCIFYRMSWVNFSDCVCL